MTFTRVKGTQAAVCGPKSYEWDIPKIPGISTLQCFDYKSSGVILARKSYNVGPGITLKSKKYEFANIPAHDMAAIQHAAFDETEGSKNNLFQPNKRVRDSKVLTRDVPACQMWLKLRAKMTGFNICCVEQYIVLKIH